MKLRSINPATLEVVYETDELNSDQVEQKLSLANKAFTSWRQTSYAQRTRYMKQAAVQLRKQKANLAHIISQEVGKPLLQAKSEIEKCALVCDYYAINAKTFLKPELISTDATESFVRYDPLGPILAIMPWNFPFWQVFRFAAPALMAGNVGILKHASNVQRSAVAIEEIFRLAGFPDGVFLNLALSAPKVQTIIRDRRVVAVTFTGSAHAGSVVAEQAGKEIKKTVLELGGSDPFIVLADADVDLAVETAVAARLQSSAGQSCIAAKRFIVHQQLAKQFTNKLQLAIKKLVVGDPLNVKTDVGPLANEQMVKNIERQVNESVDMGANVLIGGKRPALRGYYYLPTILADVTLDMPVFKEEVFGPVLPIIVVKNSTEAFAVANDSSYGLGATIFSANIKKAKELAGLIETGMVFINTQVKSDQRLPFGGIKNSGFGRELSHQGIKEFVNIKTVWVK